MPSERQTWLSHCWRRRTEEYMEGTLRGNPKQAKSHQPTRHPASGSRLASGMWDTNQTGDKEGQMKSGKAPGPDNIPAEALKVDVEETIELLHPLFVKMWEEEIIPAEWKEGYLVKLPKKGDLSNCANYRGITLLSIPGKVFNLCILNRCRPTSPGSTGWISERTDQIATLCIILEQLLEWNSSLMLNFIDYEKAFDSVDRRCLWSLLRHYGVPEKVTNIIRNLYEGATCRVVYGQQLTDSFTVRTGVKQECLLSPFMFLLAIDWVMKSATTGQRNGIQWTLWTQLDDLDFADDIALFSHTQRQMQDKTNLVKDLSASIDWPVHPQRQE